MHVLTLIGCVLFSDVGPRDGRRGGGVNRVCVLRAGWRAPVCLRNCVCVA